jgi:hypothetical protein
MQFVQLLQYLTVIYYIYNIIYTAIVTLANNMNQFHTQYSVSQLQSSHIYVYKYAYMYLNSTKDTMHVHFIYTHAYWLTYVYIWHWNKFHHDEWTSRQINGNVHYYWMSDMSWFRSMHCHIMYFKNSNKLVFTIL